VSAVHIWIWRGSAYVLSVVLSVLRFHSPLGYPWTLNLFAVFAVFWLEREIRYYRTPGRAPRFESLGKASYSIYLTHVLAWGLLQTLPATKVMSIWAAWFAEIALCASLVTIFYWLVERPSHRFARRVAKQAAWLRPVVAAASASD
jgi:peptidoglycan/LPS O-acetylase OafA/YrhL